MASHKLLFHFFFFTSLASFSPLKAVNLDVYYEALCPYCANFIANDLAKLFDSDLYSIVNLRLIPWGNAELNFDGSVTCQHGASECWFNALDACVIRTYPDSKEHFKIIRCMERSDLNNELDNWRNCFTSNGVSSDEAIACLTSREAGKLIKMNAEETKNLSPPHEFVPWVVVDNEALKEDFPNFVRHVCDAYEGDQPPVACLSSLYLTSNAMEQTYPVSSVCYRNETKNVTSKTP